MPLPETMRAIRKAEPGEGLSLVELPRPRPGAGEVLVRVQAASICGTDVHIYEWDEWSAGRIRPPVTLGHEFAGVVAELGAGVDDIELGAPVSAECHVLLEGARHVLPGQEHLATEMEVIGIDRDGGFADFVLVPRGNVWRNPPSLAPEIASLQDPFGNAVHTVHAQDVAGKSVLVTGGGGLIGSMALPVARASGARAVYATDVQDARLALAERMGADLVLDARKDPHEALMRATGGAGVDVLLEMSGHPAAIDQGFRALRPGGEAALLGLPGRPIEVDWAANVVIKGATVRGIYGRRIWQTWHRMRGLLESGAVDLSTMITHRFALEDFQQAFDAMRGGQSGKVVLRP